MLARKITIALLAMTAAFTTTAVCARATDIPSRVDVRADRVAFYPYQNQTLLAAEGHVVIHEGPRTIEGDALRYDVIANKILVTGNVRVRNRTRELGAQAYALDLSTSNAEVLKIDDLPTTYAIHDEDFATEKDGPPPQDVFKQLDIDGAKPYIKSRHAIVTPGAGVRMSPAEFPTPVGPSMRLPTFLYTIVQNNNITRSSLPGSTFDQPLNLAGSPGSLLAAHLRYDSYYGPTLGFDERLVNRDKSYAVISIVPFRDRRIDAIGFEQIRPGLQQQITLEHTIGLYPYNFVQYKLQNTNRFTTTLQTDINDSNNDVGIDFATLSHDVGHYFTYQAHAGYTYDHSLYNYPVANDFKKTIGTLLQVPDVTLGGTRFGEQYNYTYTAYDYPHQVNDGTLSFNAVHSIRNVQFNGSVSFEQVADRYRDADVTARALGLPDPTTEYYAPDGTFYPGYFAFAGSSTYRTYTASATISGRGDNRVQLVLTHTHDFPQYHGFGRPPLTATAYLTRRISSQLRVDIGRSYTFGWDGRYLSPQYSFSIAQ